MPQTVLIVVRGRDGSPHLVPVLSSQEPGWSRLLARVAELPVREASALDPAELIAASFPWWDDAPPAAVEEGFRPNDKGVLERPACSAGVVDTTTGAVFVAHNRPKRMVADTNVPHGEPGYLHPLVRERVIAQQGRHDAGLDHFSNPGTHAEVLALNDAMLARDPGPEHTLTDPAVFGDFVEAPIWNKDMGTDRNGLERPAGSIAGCCGHCNRITEGVHNPVPPPGPIDKPHWPAR